MDESKATRNIREGLASFAAGDISSLGNLMSDDIVWHHPGKSSFAGDYRGPNEVIAFFMKLVQATGGTFKTETHDVVGNDEHVVALVRLTGELDGRSIDMNAANVFHADAEGRITERWLMVDDLAAFDAFWG